MSTRPEDLTAKQALRKFYRAARREREHCKLERRQRLARKEAYGK
jgi:hypothetical protein